MIFRKQPVATVPSVKKRTLTAARLIEALEGRTLFSAYSPVGIPLLTPTEGSAVSNAVVATFMSTDPLAGLTATVNWPAGATTAPSTLGTITAIGSQFVPGVGTVPQYAVSAAFTPTGATRGNAPAFNVVLHDSADATTSVVYGAMQILDAPLTTTGGIASASVTEGATVNYANAIALMTYTDAYANSTAADFRATVDWGDGSPATLGTISKSGGTYTVSGTHAFARPQSARPVVVTVTGLDGQSTTHTTSITVTDAPLSGATGVPVTGTTGQPLNGVLLGTFLDGNPQGTVAGKSAVINWGDGSPLSQGVLAVVGGTSSNVLIAVYGSHAYDAPSGTPYAVSVAVSDGGAATTVNTTAAIADPAPTSTTAPTLTALAAGVVVSEGPAVPAGTVFGTIVDGDLPGAGTYTATATVGGTTVPLTATRTGSAGNYTLTATSSTAIAGGLKAGGRAFSLAVSKSTGAAAAAFGVVAVTDAPMAVISSPAARSVNQGQALSNVAVMTFADADPSAAAGDYLATIDWGDGTPATTGVVSADAGQFTVTGSHAYAAAGTIPAGVHVTVRNLDGQTVAAATGPLTVTATTTVPPLADPEPTVPTGPAPTLVATVTPDLSVKRKATLSKVLATFVDTNASHVSKSHYVGVGSTIDWGDGTTSVLKASDLRLAKAESDGRHWKVKRKHRYATAGEKLVTISLRDDSGAVTTTTMTITVRA